MKELDNEIVKRKLDREGYVYWFPPRTWGERDILGVFDFIAVRGKTISLVQVTTIDHLSHRRRKIQDFFRLNNIFIPNCYVWAYDRKKEIFKSERII